MCCWFFFYHKTQLNCKMYIASGRPLNSKSKTKHLSSFKCMCIFCTSFLFVCTRVAWSDICDINFGKQIRYFVIIFPSCSSSQLGFVLPYFLPQLFSCCFARFTHWRRLQKHALSSVSIARSRVDVPPWLAT